MQTVIRQMFKTLVLIVGVGAVSYALTDIENESIFLSVALPIVVLMSLISFAIWMVLFVHKMGIDNNEGIQKVENNAPLQGSDIAHARPLVLAVI